MAIEDSGPEHFWMSLIGPEHGVQFGMMVQLLAEPEFTAALREAVDRLGREESVGPILDPTFWARTPNAFGRATLCKDLLNAGVRLGEAERKRREGWGG